MRLPSIILTALCCWMVLVIFLHLDDMSVEIYDEARRAVSAAEMARGDAHWLVPTYNGAPDHWGTKPALLVLCQAFWMKIFGVGELAVRLPSALATLCLCGLLIWWGRRDWGGALAGAMGGLFVLCCWEFMGNHGARTGDFDAMLTLFLTAQVVFFYQWVRAGQTKWLWLAGAAVLLAGLTKGIAGGFFLPGIGLWLLATKAGRQRLLRPELYGIIGLALLLVLSYYFVRNGVDPEYLEMVKNNELGGRFAQTNEGHRHPFWFYGQRLVQDPTLGFLVPLLLPALLYFFVGGGTTILPASVFSGGDHPPGKRHKERRDTGDDPPGKRHKERRDTGDDHPEQRRKEGFDTGDYPPGKRSQSRRDTGDDHPEQRRKEGFDTGDAGAMKGSEDKGGPALLVALVVVVFMTVISVAATKLYWYKNPVLPLLGMLVGGMLFRVAEALAQTMRGRTGKLVIVSLLAALFLIPMVQITERTMRPRNYQETPERKLGYRDFMRAKEIQPPYTVLVRDYHPNARFYVLQAQSRGEDVQLKRTKKLLPPLVYNARPPGGLEVGERVIICHSETWNYLFKRFRMKEEFKRGKCKLMQLDRRREDFVE